MPGPISELLLRQFSEFLAARMGLHFPPARWPDMLRGLERAAREFGQAGAEACMRSLLASPPDRRRVEILASHLTVGETYFYREPAVFAALENEILPALIDARHGLARQLGMEIVAKGVEDRDDWDFLRRTGCDLAQGYFIARPMPAADLPGWMEAWQGRAREWETVVA